MTTHVILDDLAEEIRFRNDENHHFNMPINRKMYGSENQLCLDKELVVTKKIRSKFLTFKVLVELIFHQTNETAYLKSAGPFYKRYYYCTIGGNYYEIHFFRNGNMGIFMQDRMVAYIITDVGFFSVPKQIQKIFSDDNINLVDIYAINMAVNFRFNKLPGFRPLKTYPILSTKTFDPNWRTLKSK